ncbi:MAG: tellurite resistance TerB family protein [Pseudomonadota bacterium]
MSIDALSPQDALVAVMIATSAADEEMSPPEFKEITSIVELLPVFRGYDIDRIEQVGAIVSDLFSEEDGLDALLGLVKGALHDHLRETAYALACDVAAADGTVKMTELRWLEELRHEISVGRLAAAAIERGARARHQRLDPPPSA